MNLRLTLTLLCAVTLQEALAGKIHGTVRVHTQAEIQPAAPDGIATTRNKQSTNLSPVRVEKRQDFLVFVEGVTMTNVPPEFLKPVNVEARRGANQVGAVFSPHVLPVMRGATVRWVNSDQVYHNMFSMSEAAAFDLGLCKPTANLNGEDVAQYTFEKPGRVDVFCSIHANMNCVVYVMDNPWFSGTDGRGFYFIPNLPPGTYQLRAWGERIPSLVKEVTVDEDSDLTVNFILGAPAEQASPIPAGTNAVGKP